jgi:AcrR family transcriptional regulator
MRKSPGSAAPSLQAAKQETVRSTIAEHAIPLFCERGYDRTTIDDLARAAGIGRRTFFRYFDTKDDVVLWRFDMFARHAVTLLRERPAREPALTALEHALTEASEFYNQQPEQTVRILRLTEETPSLYAQQLLQQDRWKGWFADVLRERGKFGEGSVQPEIAAAAGFEAMAIAVRRWVDAPAVGLSQQISRCFAALRKVVSPTR